jgi:hypothetical protein
MKRWFPSLALASLLLVACSTAKPATQQADVDPVTDPSIVGAVDEAVLQGTIEAEEAAEKGRRVGNVLGILAAVFAGPEHDSVDGILDRYWTTREITEITATAIGASKGAKAGAKRGFQLDLQFAELTKITGVEALRPLPDQIDVRFTEAPTPETLAALVAVFAGREERALMIEGPGDTSFELREALVDLGLPSANLNAHRDDGLDAPVLRIRYRD